MGKTPDRAAHAGRSGPVRGRRWADHRGTLEAIAWKYRTNSPWRDLPEELGSFQTAHKRLIRWAVDGTWEKIFAAVLAAADAIDDIGWTVVITNRTDMSDQLTNPSKRHGLVVLRQVVGGLWLLRGLGRGRPQVVQVPVQHLSRSWRVSRTW